MTFRSPVRYFLLLLIALYSMGAAAQTPTGTIEGLVTDKTGAVVPGATITIVQNATSSTRSTTADAAGRYVIPFVLPGVYLVKVEANGFRSAQQANVVVEVAGSRPINFQLEVGSVTQSIVVNASTESLDADSSTVGSTINSQVLLELPDNGRNPFDFATLVPGVSNVGGASTPHISGSRNGNNEQMIDGMTNILPENNVGNNLSAYQPVEDSVQEVNVQTSVLPAEYGRFSGGTISLITKSGGNDFHGSYFEFIQQGALNAIPFGSPGQKNSNKKPDMHQYQSGGTISGPIRRNRAFFFFDYEKSTAASGSYGAYRVPDPALMNGDFSSLFGSSTPVLYDPDTVAMNASGVYVRQPFMTNGQYNVIPQSRISKVAQKLLSYYPKPNMTPNTLGGNNYQTTQSVPGSYWHFDSREDVDVTRGWHSFLRYSMQQNTSTVLNDYNNAASPGGWGGAAHGYNYSGSFNNTVTFSPTLLAEFRYGYSKSTTNRVPVGGSVDPSTLGFDSGYAQQSGSQAPMFPHFDFGGANNGGYSDLGPLGWEDYQEDPLAQSVNASVVKILSGHSLKFGGEFRALRLNFYQYSYPSGTFDLNDSWTRQQPQSYDGSTGYSMASMLLGLPSGGWISSDPKFITNSQYIAFYGQDDWKVTPKLTLNIGLRYDFELPREEQHNQLVFWDPTAASPLQAYSGAISSALSSAGESCSGCGNLLGAMTIVGSPGARYGRRQGPVQKTDFGPRFGLAYSATPKVVVRAGAGIVFQPSAMQAAGTSGAAGSDGFNTSTNFNPSFDNQTSLPVATLYSPDPALSASAQTPYPTGFAQPQAKTASCLASAACVAGIDIGNTISAPFFDNYRTPYSIQWNGNVQFAAPWGVQLEVGYVGNRGLFLIQGDPGKPYDQLSTATLDANGCTVGASTAQCKLSHSVANPFASVLGPGSPFYLPGLALGGSTITAARLAHRYPQYNNVYSYRKPDASSTYNAFTVRAEKRMARGLNFTLAFTDGREYDNGASSVSYLGASSQTYADQYNPRAEWSIGAQNVSYIVAGSFVYELPFGKGQTFLNSSGHGADKFINGWQISAIENWSSGTPIVLGSADNGTTAETYGNGFNQRPAWNGVNPKLENKSYKLWFNPNVYSVPLSYQIGNAPRTISVNNPSYQNFDLQFAKNTRFGADGRYNVQCRLEMFNAFNHPVLAGPGNSVTSSQFGVISGYSNSARRLQFAAKFTF